MKSRPAEEAIQTIKNPETAFKGNLSFSNNVIWKLPALEDWKLADVNGPRKVLPNIDHSFWTSTSDSQYRFGAWIYYGDDGDQEPDYRSGSRSVRCVGFVTE